jgi:phosphopantetheinyl transferase
MCLFEKANGMTSINFERNQILCREPGDLPGFGEGDRILLLTAGLDVFPEVSVAPTERDRAAVMEGMTARRFLAARRLVRGIFSKILGLSPENIGLTLDASGKPFLPGNNYYFSVAHSGETVAVAVSRSRVGVDLETERPVDVTALARRFFSQEEGQFIVRNPTPEHFFRLWTCREAVVKADGRGLGRLLGITAVSTGGDSADGEIKVRVGDEGWTALHWPEPGRLHLAIAFQNPPLLISWCDLRREVIL